MQTWGKLPGKRVLVVEDEYFLAETLVDELVEHGAQIAGPVSTVNEALALLDGGDRFDAAVIDVNLSGEMAYPVADRLAASGIRFVFTTGYHAAALPARFRAFKAIEKPYPLSAIVDALVDH